MMAGAPGALGSLVIFSSSGEMGWNPMDHAAGVRSKMQTVRNREGRAADLRRVDMARSPGSYLSLSAEITGQGDEEACKPRDFLKLCLVVQTIYLSVPTIHLEAPSVKKT